MDLELNTTSAKSLENNKRKWYLSYKIWIPILVALIGFAGLCIQERLEYLSNQKQIEIKNHELQLARLQYEGIQRSRYDNVIMEYIPKLMSTNETERSEALAVLVILYPNDVENILTSVYKSLTESKKQLLVPSIEKAKDTTQSTGEWGIVIGSDKSQSEAEYEVQRAKSLGFEATIYKTKDDWFVTVIEPFPNNEAANSALIIVRGKLRSGSYIVNLKTIEGKGYQRV